MTLKYIYIFIYCNALFIVNTRILKIFQVFNSSSDLLENYDFYLNADLYGRIVTFSFYSEDSEIESSQVGTFHTLQNSYYH